MVFKRYIYKNGKKIGPYYYENKKVNGKVISTYLGTTLPEGKKLGKPIKSRTKDFLKGKYKYIIIGGAILLLLITLVNFLFLVKLEPTGEISVTLDTPEQGEYLSGIVKLTMRQGELVPASAVYVIDNVGERSQFPLSSLIDDEQVEGDFYMRGFDISGRGMGYGVIGEKTSYPEVEFTMKITKVKIKEEVKDINTEESITPKELLITGKAIAESAREVKGTVSFETPHTYELAKDETAEIISSSQPIELEIKDNIAIVTTRYSKTEQGFGEDYLTEQNVEFSFDLENLNLLAKEGELVIALMYEGDELISATKMITMREKPEPEEPVPEEPTPSPPLPAGKGSTNLFFEDCASISEWTIFGNWQAVVPLQVCRSTFYVGAIMDSIIIDASAPNIKYANLSFNYSNNRLRNKDYLRVYAANSTSGWRLIFSTYSVIPGKTEINISRYIKLDNNVKIRGECSSGNKAWCEWDSINLTAYTSENQPPQILYVQSIPPQDPTESGTTTVVFEVRVSDPDGYGDIVSVSADFSKLGETTRSGICSFVTNINPNTASYSCSVNMWYYDGAGDWTITIRAQDSIGQTAIDSTNTFTYNQLNALTINLPVGALNWPILNPGNSNVLCNNDPNEIENTGNFEGQISITAYNLVGQTNPTETISAANFRAGTTTGIGAPECTATQLQDSTPITIAGSILPKASDTGISTEQIYYCISSVPFVSSQTYSATGANAWMIAIV